MSDMISCLALVQRAASIENLVGGWRAMGSTAADDKAVHIQVLSTKVYRKERRAEAAKMVLN